MILTVMLATVLTAPALGQQVSVPEPRLDPQVAVLLDNVANANDDLARRRALDRLERIRTSEPERLVGQLLAYSALPETDTTREAMVMPVVIDALNIDRDELFRGVAPYIETRDPRLWSEAEELLQGIANPTGAPDCTDYSIFHGYLGGTHRGRAAAPDRFVRWMYQHDPGSALLMFMRLDNPAGEGNHEARRKALWAKHLVDVTLWRQRNGFREAEQARPEALSELKSLAGSNAWWIRLYVAEVMRQEPALRDTAVVQRLQADPSPLVQSVATETQEK